MGLFDGILGSLTGSALGGANLGELAAKLGLPAGAASSGLAEMLPRLIDQMTPQGEVPQGHEDLISQGLAMLGKLGRG